MAPHKLIGIIIAALGAATLGACATTPSPPPPQAMTAPPPPPAPPPPMMLPAPPRGFPPPPADGLLSALPPNAQAGECFAKVSVRGRMLAPPPVPPHAVWVMTPARPGEIGPTFCLYYEAGAPPPPKFAPDRTGWIRVACDRDLTPARVRGIQGRLSALGLYQGPVHGRYDAETARAVARFQERRAIPHGGYLSLDTLRALDGDGREAAGPAPAPTVYPGPAFDGAPAAPLAPPASAQALLPPGLPPGAVVLPAPCGPAPCAAPFARDRGVPPDRGFLSWAGKSLY